MTKFVVNDCDTIDVFILYRTSDKSVNMGVALLLLWLHK